MAAAAPPAPLLVHEPLAAGAEVHHSATVRAGTPEPSHQVREAGTDQGWSWERVAAALRSGLAWARRNKSLVALLCVALVATVLFFSLPSAKYLTMFMGQVHKLGRPGLFVVIALMIVSCVLVIPGVLIGASTGYLYRHDFLLAFLAMQVGVVAGACLAFLIGRYLLHEPIRRRMAGNRLWTAVDKAITAEGPRLIFLMRLSPLFPFFLFNYAASLTTINFVGYSWSSFLGCLPLSFLYIYIGASLHSLADLSDADSPPEPVGAKIFFWVGFAFSVALVWYISRKARAALNKALDEHEHDPDPHPADRVLLADHAI